MYGSGSTWLFNAARAIATSANPGVNCISRFVMFAPSLEAQPSLDTVQVAVVKSHMTDHHTEAWLDARAQSILGA
jgi:hypothetical protein